VERWGLLREGAGLFELRVGVFGLRGGVPELRRGVLVLFVVQVVALSWLCLVREWWLSRTELVLLLDVDRVTEGASWRAV
jgi:hypothetical protein